MILPYPASEFICMRTDGIKKGLDPCVLRGCALVRSHVLWVGNLLILCCHVFHDEKDLVDLD